MAKNFNDNSLATGASRKALWLTLIFLVLMVIGYTNLYSAGRETDTFAVQLRHLPVALSLFVFTGWFLSIRFFAAYAYLPYVIILIALLVVDIMGHAAGGAQRWLRLGIFGFQPSEFAKLALAIAVAKYFYNNRGVRAYDFSSLWPLLLATGAVFVLIFEQPDFGTAGVCGLIVCAQLFFVRIQLSRRMIASMVVGGISASAVGWMFFLRPYQKLRVLNLLDPTMDPSGSGYNSLQSLVAVGSGSLFGKGLLQGTQTQLAFLPARHTDFIFSVFAEEHGFWGGTVVFVLFGAIAYIGLEIARESRDAFSSLLAVGIAALIFIEFFINVAMVLGIFPVVGMPLPFFSFGGSSLITVCVCIGLLVSIDRDNVKGLNSPLLGSIAV